MKKLCAVAFLLFAACFSATPARAEVIRAFIAEVRVTPPEPSGLSLTLKTLLASRLSGDGFTLAESASGADVMVTLSLTQIGKVFSLDATAHLPDGKGMASAFEQGESQDALIPALGKVTSRLKSEIVANFASHPPVAPRTQVVPGSPPPPAEVDRRSWLSPRIEGVKASLAPVASRGEEEYLLADGNAIELYRRDKPFKVIAQEKIPARMKILALDTLKERETGATLAFVSIVDDEAASSRVYAVTGGTLRLVAKDLPYLFRTIALDGREKHLFAQQVGRNDAFYGDVYQAEFENGKVTLKGALRMPRFGNVFNFNRFKDGEGKSYYLAYSEDGYLVVYSEKREEIWRSSDKFGGSETYFKRRDPDTERFSGNPYRKSFIDQRIVVTEKGEVVVPQNAGFFVLGDARAYSKYTIASFTWNGSSLEERWRSKQNQNYLADFYYDPGQRELVLLEVVQKEGLWGKGGSALRALPLP